MLRYISRMATGSLPYFAQGSVVKGFGRGSKELGIPTANLPEHVIEKLPSEVSGGIYYGWATNLPEHVVEKLPSEMSGGIYYGWASVDSGEVHKMVLSIGWNPYYKNERRSMETHIIHDYGQDFYGALLKVVMLGHIRPERGFNSLDELIEAIHSDIKEANEKLELPENLKFKEHNFFKSIPNGKL